MRTQEGGEGMAGRKTNEGERGREEERWRKRRRWQRRRGGQRRRGRRRVRVRGEGVRGVRLRRNGGGGEELWARSRRSHTRPGRSSPWQNLSAFIGASVTLLIGY